MTNTLLFRSSIYPPSCVTWISPQLKDLLNLGPESNTLPLSSTEEEKLKAINAEAGTSTDPAKGEICFSVKFEGDPVSVYPVQAIIESTRSETNGVVAIETKVSMKPDTFSLDAFQAVHAAKFLEGIPEPLHSIVSRFGDIFFDASGKKVEILVPHDDYVRAVKTSLSDFDLRVNFRNYSISIRSASSMGALRNITDTHR